MSCVLRQSRAATLNKLVWIACTNLTKMNHNYHAFV